MEKSPWSPDLNNIKTAWDLQRQKQPGAKVWKRTAASAPRLFEKPSRLLFFRNFYNFLHYYSICCIFSPGNANLGGYICS